MKEDEKPLVLYIEIYLIIYVIIYYLFILNVQL